MNRVVGPRELRTLANELEHEANVERLSRTLGPGDMPGLWSTRCLHGAPACDECRAADAKKARRR